jgi:hypothetical protein
MTTITLITFNRLRWRDPELFLHAVIHLAVTEASTGSEADQQPAGCFS